MGVMRKGISLREAIKAAQRLGIVVETVWRTGEVSFRADGLTTVRVNGRRKDIPRVLAKLLRDVEDKGRGR